MLSIIPGAAGFTAVDWVNGRTIHGRFVRCAGRAQPGVEAIEVSQSRLPAISSLRGDRTRRSASDGRWALFWERACVILSAAALIGGDTVAFEQSETKAVALRQF